MNPGLREIGEELQQVLSGDEYATARKSTQYAHYTSEPVVRAMWGAVERMGFKGGKVFEPGMGTGNFVGMMPEALTAKSEYTGVEMDPMTARIAQTLYPQHDIREEDFTKYQAPKETFDLAIGNPPFADIPIKSDPAYAKHAFLLHDYFFAKTMDALRPGGLLAFISSAGTLNKMDPKARNHLADRADLVGAIRLPGNAFAKNAGTEVTTDIIFLRKREAGEKPGDRTWTQTGTFTGPDKTGEMKTGYKNAYFDAHPEMVLGEEGFFDTLHLGRYAVRARPGDDLAKLLEEAIQRLPADVMAGKKTPNAREKQTDTRVAETKNGSFYMKDGGLFQFEDGRGVPVRTRGPGVIGGRTKTEQETVKRLIPIRDALRAVYAADATNNARQAAKARKDLNRLYDAFVASHGPINRTVVTTSRPTLIQQEKARNEAREQSEGFDEGSFDPNEMLLANRPLKEIAEARQKARNEALAKKLPWDEGSFNPEEMPDNEIFRYPNIDPFADDPESYRLRAIEDYDRDSGKATKRLVFTKNPVAVESAPAIRSVGDALLHVLNKTGQVDIGAIMEVSGKSRDAVIGELGDKVFPLPGRNDKWVTRDEYLSGRVRTKLQEAKEAAERDPAFERNVEALVKVQPAPLAPEEIRLTLGMNWIPENIIEDFATKGLGLKHASVTQIGGLGEWLVRGDERSAEATSVWGTPEKSAIELLRHALNKQVPRIHHPGDEPGKQGPLNVEATGAAVAKLQEIQEKFTEWASGVDALFVQYNELFNNNVVPNRVDGEYLTTPGVRVGWEWRPHQKSVIARIIMRGNTYMGHCVGSGKTSAMIGSSMEMRRLGLVKKPMFVVPNHMLIQFTNEFYDQYPTAKIMVADEEKFHTSRRKQFIADVASQDLDAVIITHSAFGMIPISDAFQNTMLEEQVEIYRNAITEAENEKGEDSRITIKRLEKQVQRLKERIAGQNSLKKDQVFTFEEMGVDFLYVDEAHEFRKLSFPTKQQLKGIDPEGSKKAWDLFTKTRYLETVRPGRNLVMASGTPVTNTMGELFNLSRFIQPKELEQVGLNHFDDWSSMFGTVSADQEQTPTGGYQLVTRFNRFVNVADLSRMVRQNMDVVTSTQLGEFVTRPQNERNLHVLPRLPILQSFQKHLSERWEKIKNRHGKPKPGDDIILNIIGDGRKASFDMRLIDKSAPSDPDSKLNTIIRNVHSIWQKTAKHEFFDPKTGKSKGRGPASQIIFADQGVNPLNGFHAYGWMVRELVRMGVPRDQIAVINDFKSHSDKQKLFAKVKTGAVRILIGSTAKLGTGTNVQDRLFAIHNADPQWYPAADEQRVGRIVRQGNFNRHVEVHDYSVKGTYDATMWKMMAKKARFIEEFFRGDPNLREMEDLGEASMYEQASGMTVTDDRILRLVTLKQELSDAKRKKVSHGKDQARVRGNISSLSEEIDAWGEKIPLLEKDLAQRVDVSGEKFKAVINGETLTKRADVGQTILHTFDTAPAGKDINKKIGTMGGFDLHMRIAHKQDMTGKYDVKMITLERHGGPREVRIDKFSTDTGIVQSLEYAIRTIDQELTKAKARIKDARTELEGYKKRVGTPFAGQEKINTLQDQVNALEADLIAHPEKQEEDDTPVETWKPPADVGKTDESQEPANGGFFDGQIKESRPPTPAPSTLFTASSQQALSDHLVKVGLDGKIAVKVVEALRGGVERNGAAGTYQNRLIEIAATHGNKMAALNHEIIHALRDLGVLRPLEWTVLKRHVEADEALMESVAERYPELTHDEQVEEAIADRFAEWMDTPAPKGFIEKAFTRSKAFIEAVGNWLRGNGFRSAREVFKDIASGEVGKRHSVRHPETGRYAPGKAKEMRVFGREITKRGLSVWAKDLLTQSKPTLLQFLGGRQLTEMYARIFPNDGEHLKELTGLIQSQDADMNKLAHEASKVTDDWEKLPKNESDNLTEVMHSGTVWEYHPDEPFDDNDLIQARLMAKMSNRAVTAFQRGHNLNDLSPAEQQDFDKLTAAVHHGKMVREVVGFALQNGMTKQQILSTLAKNADRLPIPTDKAAALESYNTLSGEEKIEYRTAGAAGYGRAVRKLDAFKNGHKIDNLNQEEKAEYDRLTAALTKHSKQERFESERSREAAKGIDLYQQLSEEAKKVYRSAREMYAKRYADVRSSLEEQIKDNSTIKPKEAQRLIASLRLKFEKNMVSRGPYFPLSRFGKYTVFASGRDLETFFGMAETPAEQRELVQALRESGYQIIETGFNGEFTRKQREVAPQFVKEVITILDGDIFDSKAVKESKELERSREAMKDAVWQMYLETMPQFSIRKKFIHRKKTAGWSQDALRAFAQHMFHASKQIARMRYGYKMQNELDAMTEEVTGRKTVVKEVEIDGKTFPKVMTERMKPEEMVTPENKVLAGQVLDEMVKRHEQVMNPPGSGLANRLNAAGFLLYLGLSPASGLVNLLQTPMVAIPIIGARYGNLKTWKVYRDVAMEYKKKAGFLTDNPLLSEDERKLMKKLSEDGTIDVTQTHDLAGLGGDEGLNPLRGKTRQFMQMAGWFFHAAERINRESTALMVYRLARGKGMNHEEALVEVKDLVHKTHFDYSANNRPRIMRGDVMRVITQFKQYGQNTAYTLARAAYLSVKGQSPEEIREARHQLTSLLLTHFMAAGVAGLPLVWVVPMVMSAVAGAFGDDDEYYDPEAYFRNLLNDSIGQLPGQMIAKGPVSALTGLDFASRLGLADLFWRSTDQHMEGRDAFAHGLTQILGPMVGYVGQVFAASQVAGDGNPERALEMVVPKAVRDVMKAGRYVADGGVITMKGDRVLEDQLSATELMAQAIGFSPLRVNEQYSANTTIRNAERFVNDRRQKLLNQYAEAWKQQDQEGMESAKEAFMAFNQEHPRYAITGDTVMHSLKAREQMRRRAVGGMVVNPKLAELRELGRYGAGG
ncbi:MAG: PLxRFG domain-containing protein [Magnetococcales bacterium]|nr:PLxRFG domain-containing protein [Magnetococcales bacterium]